MRDLWFGTLLVTFCLCMAPSAIAQDAEEKAPAGEVKETVTTVHEKTTTVRERITEEVVVEDAEPKIAAIFIKNRAGSSFDGKVSAYEDLIIGEITDLGLQVMSPEDTVNAVRKFLGTKSGEKLPGDQLDKLLAANTSAIRLAQNMGVDYVVIASMTTYGSSTQHIKRDDLGIDRKVTTHKLRSTYKILDIAKGSSLTAGNLTSEKRIQAADGFSENADVINDLIADAASKIAAKFEEKGGIKALPKSTKLEGMVDFEVFCSMQDMSVPEVIKTEDGGYMLTANRYKLNPLSVTVELDGVVIGTAPGKLHAYPGLHKIRLTREGFEDWERTINIRDGQTLQIAMTLTKEGRDYWFEMSDFFAKLKRDERLSEANAELIKGIAQKMRQSGLRIDRRVDINVDTKDAPTIEQNNVEKQNVVETAWD